MKKIESLTIEQEEQMIAFREEWRKIGLSTEPVDKEQTKEAISEMYRLIGKKPPQFIFCPSLIFVQFQIAYCEELFKLMKQQGINISEIGESIPANLRANRQLYTSWDSSHGLKVNETP